MKYILTFGYIGFESGNTSLKNKDEPILSLEKTVRILKLENKAAKIGIDFNLIWQGSTKKKENSIKRIWRELSDKKWQWDELKPKLSKLLELGDVLLPIVFDINFANFSIEVVDGEETILVVSEDIKKLKILKKELEKESVKRVTPYGLIEIYSKVILEKAPNID